MAEDPRPALLPAIILSVLLSACQSNPAQTPLTDSAVDYLVLAAPVILEGEVIGTEGSAAFVSVSRVAKAPNAFSIAKGTIVRILPAAPLTNGDKYLFFARGTSYGTFVTLKEQGRIPVGDRVKVELVGNLILDLPSRLQRELMARSDAVVAGTVERIEPIDVDAKFVFSEHAAETQVLWIRVQETVIGSTADTLVPVIYQVSGDVVWADRRRFRIGESGIWFLHATPSEIRSVQAYQSGHESEFITIDSLQAVRENARRLADTTEELGQ